MWEVSYAVYAHGLHWLLILLDALRVSYPNRTLVRYQIYQKVKLEDIVFFFLLVFTIC